MYSVLLVEDEMLVRLGLKNSINWGKFDMQVIADVDNGETALEIYEKQKPDLIITDLKMPCMSGMELITRIREKDADTKIVILTCLEEFKLVRKAISMGVSDYILKLTMTIDEINVVLAKVSRELSADKDRQASRGLNQTDFSLLGEKVIKDYIFYKIYNEKEFAALAEKYGFRFKPDRMVLCAMEIDNYSRIRQRFEDDNGQLIQHAMMNMLDEILGNCKNGEIINDSASRYIVIMNVRQIPDSKKYAEEITQLLKSLENPVKSYFNTTLTFGLSEARSDYSSLRKMYDQALAALEAKFFGGTGIYGLNGDFDLNAAKAKKTDEMLRLCEKIPGIPQSFLNDYSGRIHTIMDNGSHTRAEYLEMFCRLVQWTVNALKFHDEGSEKTTVSAIQAIQQSETLDEIYRFMYEFLSRVSAAKRKKKITSREVKLALDYIESNYCTDLSLQQVSAHVGLSPSYLSSLFKKEIDINFVDYLNEIRIDKAKELLLETYLKTYEIAENVGYNENTYFCKMFKKVTGTTPGEYRKQWLKKWTEETEDEACRQQ